MELCLLKGGKGMGLLEDDCDLMDVAVSVGLDLGDALLACNHCQKKKKTVTALLINKTKKSQDRRIDRALNSAQKLTFDN